MKMIWSGWKIQENYHVFVNQFLGNFRSKTLCCGKITCVFRDVKWCFNASWGLKGLTHFKNSIDQLSVIIIILLYRPISTNHWLQIYITNNYVFDIQGGAPCPSQESSNCITPWLFFIFIALQMAFFIGYAAYRWEIILSFTLKYYIAEIFLHKPLRPKVF